jgi:hypothetical protein
VRLVQKEQPVDQRAEIVLGFRDTDLLHMA